MSEEQERPKRGKKIGGNWVETVDPSSGKVYFANVVTRKVTWSRPTEEEIEADLKAHPTPEPTKTSKKKKADRPNIWLERQDPNTGLTYYYNPALGQTSWHRPTENTISTGVLQNDDAGKGAWVERVDPKSKRRFYYNPVLQKTSWTNPDEEERKQKEKMNQSAAKRLSLSIAQNAKSAGNRLSQRLSQTLGSVTGSGGNRASARYSLAIPQLPTNRTSARASIRFGTSAQKKVDKDGKEITEFEPISEDRFAKLRAMKNRDVLLGKKIGEEVVEEQQSSLELNLDSMVEELDWLFDTAPFFRYAQEFFNHRQGGILGGAVDLNQAQGFSKSPLKQPLHALSLKELKEDAKTASKAILAFMGDKKSSRSQEHHARILAEVGNSAPDEFKNEIYAQLIKQTSGNPDPKSLLKGWQLFALCTGLFKPGIEILPYVKSHIKDAVENSKVEGVKKYAEYAMLRLEKTKDMNERLEIPSIIEATAALRREPLTIRVHLINRTAINVQADTWTTIKDVNSAIASKLGIKDGTPFTTFEVDDAEQERYLEETDRVLDIVAYWERDVQERRKKRYVPSYQFMYKMRLFFDVQEDDISAIELAYYQAVNDVTDSRYPCTESDAIRLAALEAQEKFGDYEEESDVFGDNLALYVQNKYYSEETKEDMKSRIYDAYRELRGYTPLEAKLNYLDYVKAWKIYGSAYFVARPQNTMQTKFPPEVVIAVNNKGVLVVDPVTKEFLGDYPYSEVVTWGHSSTTFVLVVGNLIKSRKIFFGTDQGLELNSLIHAYVNKLAEVQ